MEAKIDWLVEHVTVLRVKAGFYGATGGVVFGAITGALVARLV